MFKNCAFKQITHHLVINEIVESNLIPQFRPYSSNRIPSKEEVEEFDANNKKIEERLAKKDKTKRVEIEKLGRTKEDKGRARNHVIMLN
ncbi:hypothetical protein RhiirA4_489467 [Rhizophagus irregularis]|uniref:Uncharacterized protein n=1 Tax=Rhizophagus irregularis TaxID=588596 RepID=A0A2I1HUU7_9GLOM|nr:hypothetical protein RhiirA4_489467 [Rhizophagus irregularis]